MKNIPTRPKMTKEETEIMQEQFMRGERINDKPSEIKPVKTKNTASKGNVKMYNLPMPMEVHAKAKMLPPDEVPDRIGHAVGGVCPFAVKKDVSIFLDISLKRFPVVYPACGSANSAIALTPEEIFRLSGASEWVDVCKLKDETHIPQIF